jgi:plasmid stabilization system protein ParE
MEIKPPGLNIKFRKAVKTSIDKILSNPSSFASVNKRSKYRRCLTDTFPYKIYYRVSEKEITVVAIIHTSRSNSLIKRRLK